LIRLKLGSLLSPMIPLMLIGLCKILGRVSLRWYHRTGALVGWLGYWCWPPYRERLRRTLTITGICASDEERSALLTESARQGGQGATEWFKIWFAPQSEIDRLPIECRGWDAVEEARNGGKGIIFLLPHLGSFPVVVRYIASRLPFTVLYRSPRQTWLKPLFDAGSAHSRLFMAPTDLKGIGRLLRALKKGQAVGLPPDQAPNSRGGVWADFFGRRAYTTTLPRKLQRATGAMMIAGFAERLDGGQGYRLEFQPVSPDNFDEAELNRIVEALVRRCPSQFIWSYNRYKSPRQARELNNREVKRHPGGLA
jgi:KDO2-lipid IV(A) lauroyltransferase